MIKGIQSSSPHVILTGGDPSGVYYNTSGMSAGMVRYYNNAFEVYDGMTWIQITNQYASISLTPLADTAINWAAKKMQEEQELEHLASKHPAVQAAYENMKKAAEQLKATIILSKEHDTTS